MKKLYIIATLLTTINISLLANPRLDEYKRLANVAQARRNAVQKADYLASKQDKGIQMETPEFRFALKLTEYYEKLLRQEMSIIQFTEEVSRKVENYLKNKHHHIHHAEVQDQIVAFLDEFLSLPLDELKARIGTIDEAGSMQRFVACSDL